MLDDFPQLFLQLSIVTNTLSRQGGEIGGRQVGIQFLLTQIGEEHLPGSTQMRVPDKSYIETTNADCLRTFHHTLNESMTVVRDAQISSLPGGFSQFVQRIIQMRVRIDIAQIGIMKARDRMPKTVPAAVEAMHITLRR